MSKFHLAWHPYARRRPAERQSRRLGRVKDAFTRLVSRSASSRYAGGLRHAGRVPSFRDRELPADKAVWQYRRGMRIGKGTAMSERELKKLHQGSGEGTLSDPKVLFNNDTDDVSRELLSQCEKIAQNEAKRLGMTCAVIRGDLHNTTRTKDAWTGKIITIEDPTTPGQMIPMLEPIDDHLTIAFGSVLHDPSTFGTDNIKIQGHLFVNVERLPGAESCIGQRHESGLILPKPLWDMSKDFDAGLAKITGKMPPWRRRHIQDGYEECSEEYWERGNSLKRSPYNLQFKR